MEHIIHVSGSFPLTVCTSACAKENEGGTFWIVDVKEAT